MSELQSVRGDGEGRPKRGLRREPGACEPCKYFKTKCDHQMPCSACRDDTQRYSPCAYSKKIASLHSFESPSELQQPIRNAGSQTVQVFADSKTDNAAEMQNSATGDIRPVEGQVSNTAQSQSSGSFFLGLLSIPLVIDKFKYLKSAPGSAQSAISQFDGLETSDLPRSSLDALEPYEKSAGQSESSGAWGTSGIVLDANQLVEEFDAIVDLVWKGKIAQAWFQLGSFSRKSYAAYRHTCSASYVENKSTKSVQTLWSRVVHLEIHLSLMLGEPALSPLSEPRTVEITQSNLLQEENWLEATRQLLHKHIQALLALDSTQATATENFVNAAGNLLSHNAFIQAAYCITEEHSIIARELQMTVHFVFLLLRCCFAEIAQHDLTLNLEALSPATRDQIFHKRRSKLLHCRLALKSAKFVVNIFRQIFDPSAQRVNVWMQCHAAWIAATFLAIGKVRSEIDWNDASEKLLHIEDCFKHLADRHPDCHLFGPAAAKLRDLNTIPQLRSVHSKKRAATTMEDESNELIASGKRQRRVSVDQMSTPGPTGAKSESEDLSSSSDMMPATTNRQRLHEQSVPLSYGDEQGRSIPITPTSVLSYNHTPFHVGVEPENHQLDQWSNMARKQYSPHFPVHLEQAPQHYSETGIAYGQSSITGLSSPIQLFRPGFVPVDPVGYERMLTQPGVTGNDLNIRGTWDGHQLDVNDHRMRRWQNSRYTGMDEGRMMNHEHTKQDVTPSQSFQHEFAHSHGYDQRTYDSNRTQLELPGMFGEERRDAK